MAPFGWDNHYLETSWRWDQLSLLILFWVSLALVWPKYLTIALLWTLSLKFRYWSIYLFIYSVLSICSSSWSKKTRYQAGSPLTLESWMAPFGLDNSYLETSWQWDQLSLLILFCWLSFALVWLRYLSIELLWTCLYRIPSYFNVYIYMCVCVYIYICSSCWATSWGYHAGSPSPWKSWMAPFGCDNQYLETSWQWDQLSLLILFLAFFCTSMT